MEPSVIEHIQANAVRLNGPADLDVLIEAVGDRRYVLLGEASHGTSEFYRLRAELSRRLIAEKGFSFIAVEGDWPACYEVNRYIKSYPGCKPTGRAVLEAFNRWPSWMWANEEILELTAWLREYNQGRAAGQQAGFYGFDVYSLWESMEEIARYVERHGTAEEQALARQAFECFEPHQREGQQYGMAAAFLGDSCQEEVVQLLRELQNRRPVYDGDPEAALSAELNALAVADAERYYRTMVRHDAASWNVRDRHMVEALRRLMQFHGPDAKTIVWAHNTHIGDARETDMAGDGMVNVGQLLREAHGEADVFAVGFGTYRGTVIAAEGWGAPLAAMTVPPGRAGSWESLLHEAGAFDQILLFQKEDPLLGHDAYGHRAIGVVYHPGRERGNYVPSVMARRYDAFVHVDESHALRPLALEPEPV